MEENYRNEDVRCMHCGASNAAGSRFCSGCGKPLTPAEPAAMRPGPGADKNVLFLVLGIVSFVLGAEPNRMFLFSLVPGILAILLSWRETGWCAYTGRVLGLCGVVLGFCMFLMYFL